MGRCVIIGGADIGKYKVIQNYFSEEDFFIFCDSGLNHEKKLGITPNLIIGDFDSFQNPLSKIETIVLPCEKDDTDSIYAVKEAMKRGFDEFLLAGVIGNRMDHTLANLSILLFLDSNGKKGTIVDDYSEMELVAEEPVWVEDSYAYFSLLNISGIAKGITIKNAKYPLTDGEITSEYQYGISNEVLPGTVSEITVREGKLLLIKIREKDC